MKRILVVSLFSSLVLCSNVNGVNKKTSSDSSILSTLMWSSLQLPQLPEEKILGQQKAHSEFIALRYWLALQGIFAGFVLTSIVRAHLDEVFDYKISLTGGGVLGVVGFFWGMQKKYLHESYEKFEKYSPINEKLHALFKKAGATNKDLLNIVQHAQTNNSLCLEQVRMVYHRCEYPLMEMLYDLRNVQQFTTKAAADCLFFLENHSQLSSEQHDKICYYRSELQKASQCINCYMQKLSVCPEMKQEIAAKREAEEKEARERSEQFSFEQKKTITKMQKQLNKTGTTTVSHKPL